MEGVFHVYMFVCLFVSMSVCVVDKHFENSHKNIIFIFLAMYKIILGEN